MTYDELEQRIGKPLKESVSTTASDWIRFTQTLRRDGIREAERRLCLSVKAVTPLTLRARSMTTS